MRQGKVKRREIEMDKRAKVVIAFLEFMVDQLLPTTSAAADRQASQLSKHHSLPQQVQSLVLMYNYYYRKEQYPLVPFVPFEEFCHLLVSLRPTLSAFMKFTKTSHESESDDEELVSDKLSITEQKIKEACDISKHLDASKESPPSFDEWPITKVAVLLVDYWFEDCFLMFGSNTKGTWSLIEQELDDYYDDKVNNVVDAADDEEVLLEIAYSAVKKQAGVSWEEDAIMVLESYTAYSHTKVKAATRFYIIKYSWFVKMPNGVPLKTIIQSMQGGLVRESDGGAWMLVNSAVDFFPLLPYSEIISEWSSCLSRRVYPTQPYRYPGSSSAALKLSQMEIRDWDAPPCFAPLPPPPPAAVDKDDEMVAVVVSSNDIKHEDEEELLVMEAGVVELAKDDEEDNSSVSRRMSNRKKTPNKRLAGYHLAPLNGGSRGTH